MTKKTPHLCVWVSINIFKSGGTCTSDLSPSGKPNVYIKTPYVFPSVVRINGLGALSDALLGQRKWTDPQILRERNIILGNDRAAAKGFFLKWRTTAAEVAISAFQNVKAERESFIDKSYFYLLDQANGDYNTMAHPQPDSPTDMSGRDGGGE